MGMNMTETKTLAVFDFDHTLVEGDSFWPFMGYVAGWPQTIIALLEILVLFVMRRLKNKNDEEVQDYRTFIKGALMQRLLGGKPVVHIRIAVEKLVRWQKWYAPMRQELLDHHEKGHHVVVASGGLDLYLTELLRGTPHDALICTEVGIEKGIVTGTMTNGNCVRARKAELVAAYIREHGPFDQSWGYGNFPHDVPMLNLLKHRVLV